ncbi:MAG: hypothetical protein PHG63_02210 [Candidatus Dojkabacteria bacterium]|nr:hypothetical protein [Candidatus Dojkabacteria bacterium]
MVEHDLWTVILLVDRFCPDEFFESVFSVILQEYRPIKVCVVLGTISGRDEQIVREITEKLTYEGINFTITTNKSRISPAKISEVITGIPDGVVSILRSGNYYYFEFADMVRELQMSSPKKIAVGGHARSVKVRRGKLVHTVSKSFCQVRDGEMLRVLNDFSVVPPDAVIFRRDILMADPFSEKLQTLFIWYWVIRLFASAPEATLFSQSIVVDVVFKRGILEWLRRRPELRAVLDSKEYRLLKNHDSTSFGKK